MLYTTTGLFGPGWLLQRDPFFHLKHEMLPLSPKQNFLELQAQLEGTENRISVARQKFNAATKEFNSSIRKFPSVLFASSFGFEKKPYFEAEESAKSAPTIEF